MKKSFFLAPLCLAALGASAIAAHLTIKGKVSSTLVGSDNYFLGQNPSGTTFKSTNSLNLDFLARTADTDYELQTNASYFKYFGSGAQDTSLTNGVPLGATFSVNHKQKLTTYQFSTSWNRQDLASTVLTQTGIASGRGYVDTYAAQGTVTHNLTPLDSLSWTSKATRTSYTASGQTPYSDITSSVTWNHKLSRLITLTQTGSVDWYLADDQTNSQRLFWTYTSGAQAKLTRRLNLNTSFGVDFSNSYNNATSLSGSTASQSSGGAANGYLFNVQLAYQLLKETSLTFATGQNTAPTILGDLQTTRFLSLGLDRKINHHSSISASSQYSQIEGSGTRYNLFSTSVTYAYQLTRNTNATLSYQFQTRSNDVSGNAQANIVTVALTRDLTLLP